MDNVKVSATFSLPGSLLVAENSISKTEENYHNETVSFYADNKRHTLTIRLRNGKPALQKMNLTLEAYNYMISNDGKPTEISKGMWGQMSKAKKVKTNLLEIAQSLNAKLVEFTIFDD